MYKWIAPVSMTVLLLAACGDNEEVNNPPENAPTEGTGQTVNAAYSFTSFELDADYANTNDALDVSYDNEKNDIEASYEDKENKKNLTGDGAMKELESKFSSFSFDENTPDDEVLTVVTEAFNIPEDAKRVEVEIQYADGTEKEYKK